MNTTFFYKKSNDNINYENKYLKYKNKFLLLKQQMQSKNYFKTGGGKKILYLDFDETLGSFNVNYVMYAKFLNFYKINKTISDIIKKELLSMYYLRTNLKTFFEFLQKLKLEKKLDKVIIMSRNSDRSAYIGYFAETIKLIEEITETPKLIDDVILGVGHKRIGTNDISDKIYIVDDKCEHVTPKEKCLSVIPYVVYVDQKLFMSILKRVNDLNPLIKISDAVISEIETELNTYCLGDFSDSDPLSYINQYPQISDFKEKYQTDLSNLVKIYPDDELLRIIKIIEEIYS